MRMRALLAFMCCAGAALLLIGSYSGAWFTDTETIEGISISTGFWGEADCLSVSTDQARLNAQGCCLANHVLYNIIVRNECNGPVTITGIRVIWTPDAGERILDAVLIPGAAIDLANYLQDDDGCSPAAFTASDSSTGDTNPLFWYGREASGSLLDGRYRLDPAWASETGAVNLLLIFNADMSGKTFGITFIAEDGSQEEVSVQP
jgi:predicted ribosomally synthesized peptide with SipW-like signal peptide